MTAGALDQLPINLAALAMRDACASGDFAAAAALIAETDAVCRGDREPHRPVRRA